ncbi:hypothetical protein FOZ62_003531, partial [Perkinsus olseni]
MILRRVCEYNWLARGPTAAATEHRAKLQQEIDRCESFVASMSSEASLGGVMKKFDNMESFLEGEYHAARDKHRKGIELLKREFGYHPAYRKGCDR